MKTGSQLALGGEGGKYLEGKANRTEVDRKWHLLVGETNLSSASNIIEFVVKLQPSTRRFCYRGSTVSTSTWCGFQKQLLGGKCEEESGHKEGKYSSAPKAFSLQAQLSSLPSFLLTQVSHGPSRRKSDSQPQDGTRELLNTLIIFSSISACVQDLGEPCLTNLGNN